MKSRHRIARGVAVLALAVAAVPASAQDDGGLCIAGGGFSFEQAANRGLAQNASGSRCVVLAVPAAH